MVLGALIAISSSFAHAVRVNFDRAAHFASYKTYRLVPSPGAQSSGKPGPGQLMEQRIAASIQERLARRGLKRVATGGDLLVRYRLIVAEQPRSVSFTDTLAPGWGPGITAWTVWAAEYTRSTADSFYKATLVIDIVDAKRGKLVFEGTSTQSVSARPQENTERWAKAVSRVMAKYPPRL